MTTDTEIMKGGASIARRVAAAAIGSFRRYTERFVAPDTLPVKCIGAIDTGIASRAGRVTRIARLWFRFIIVSHVVMTIAAGGAHVFAVQIVIKQTVWPESFDPLVHVPPVTGTARIGHVGGSFDDGVVARVAGQVHILNMAMVVKENRSPGIAEHNTIRGFIDGFRGEAVAEKSDDQTGSRQTISEIPFC